ncbi:hypothetical protein A2U01_0001541, partial [Trifolium medium]|nr:hypothetical protein [Trifolium medium]
MKFLSWNFRGYGNLRTIRALKKLINTNSPDVMFLIETKLLDKDPIVKKYFPIGCLTNYVMVDCVTDGGGKAGGLALLWKDNLNDLGYSGSIFTWANNQAEESHIKARLDRDNTNHKIKRFEQLWMRNEECTNIIQKTWTQANGKTENKVGNYGGVKGLECFGYNRVIGILDSSTKRLPKGRKRTLLLTSLILKDRVTNDMKDYLNNPYSNEEVVRAIKQMKGLAALGPDGLPALFYQ